MQAAGAEAEGHRLPSPLPDPDTVGARVRVVGKEARNVPVAPLLVSVVGAAGAGRELPVTPTAKGVAGEWTPTGASETSHPRITPISAGGARSVTLRITSRVAGTFMLGDVVVVATK